MPAALKLAPHLTTEELRETSRRAIPLRPHVRRWLALLWKMQGQIEPSLPVQKSSRLVSSPPFPESSGRLIDFPTQWLSEVRLVICGHGITPDRPQPTCVPSSVIVDALDQLGIISVLRRRYPSIASPMSPTPTASQRSSSTSSPAILRSVFEVGNPVAVDGQVFGSRITPRSGVDPPSLPHLPLGRIYFKLYRFNRRTGSWLGIIKRSGNCAAICQEHDAPPRCYRIQRSEAAAQDRRDGHLPARTTIQHRHRKGPRLLAPHQSDHQEGPRSHGPLRLQLHPRP